MKFVTDTFSLIKGKIDELNDYLSRFTGVTGFTVRKQQNSSPMTIDSIGIINETVMIVEGEEEVNLAKGNAESFQRVFDNWLRISRSNSSTYNKTDDPYALVANPDEINEWSFDEETNTLKSTINSNTMIGFVSPYLVDDYVIEVRMRSTAGDDDEIGLLIALAYDNNGRAHTLEVMRQLRGSHPVVVVKNTGIQNITIAGGNDGLNWSDGVPATEGRGDNFYKDDADRHPWWRDFPDGVKLKVTRRGDIITVETSDLFDPDNYVDSAKITIDLSSDRRLWVFRGPKQWGYVALSQSGSTWEVLQRPIEVDVIYDLQRRLLEVYENGRWTSYPRVFVNQYIEGGVFYYNQASDRLYWAENNGDILRITLESTP